MKIIDALSTSQSFWIGFASFFNPIKIMGQRISKKNNSLSVTQTSKTDLDALTSDFQAVISDFACVGDDIRKGLDNYAGR